MNTWKRQGQFVSDCTETLAGMYAVRSGAGVFVGAFDKREDARMGAAAPDMLEALEAAEHWLDEERRNPGQAQPGEILRVIRAAIAQAKDPAHV